MSDWIENEVKGAKQFMQQLIQANSVLRAENEKLRQRLEKAHSFISRADWMQFFEEEHAAEAAFNYMKSDKS